MKSKSEADAIRPFERRIRNPIVKVAGCAEEAAFINKVDSVERRLLGL